MPRRAVIKWGGGFKAGAIPGAGNQLIGFDLNPASPLNAIVVHSLIYANYPDVTNTGPGLVPDDLKRARGHFPKAAR